MKKVTYPVYTSYVGTNVRAIRKRKGYSLEDVALATGITKAYLSQLENGKSAKPSVQIAYALYREIVEGEERGGINFSSFCFDRV